VNEYLDILKQTGGKDELSRRNYRRGDDLLYELTTSKRKYLESYSKSRSSFVALINGELVGFILGRTIESVDGHERVLWLDYIAVDARYRRIGVGLMLLSKTKEYAKNNNIDEIFTTLNTNNEPSKRLLMKSSFSVREWRIASLLV
jgi:ribosomal protein S18 acetylase RimI-like enzyme